MIKRLRCNKDFSVGYQLKVGLNTRLFNSSFFLYGRNFMIIKFLNQSN